MDPALINSENKDKKTEIKGKINTTVYMHVNLITWLITSNSGKAVFCDLFWAPSRVPYD